MTSGYGPCVVGATGGSGTRVLAQLMQGEGTFIGTELNEAGDAMEVGRFLNEWIPPYVASVHQGAAMAPDLVSAMSSQWTLAMAGHLKGLCAGQPYGWKEPRSLYLLPFWHARCPALRFLHLVRDGRDMAFSRNQNQLKLYGDLMLPGSLCDRPEPVRSVALWSRVNVWAADYGERHMTGQYLRVRFEDLCAEPAKTAARVLAFFGLPGNPSITATEKISPPATIGRWRNAPLPLLSSVIGAGEVGLERFGYCEEE